MTDALTFPHGTSPSASMRKASLKGAYMSSKSQGTVVCNKGTCVPCEREIASDRMFALLRDRYPTKTLEHVAADLNVSVDTVAKWRSRKSLPDALTCIRMMFIYGHDFFKCVAPEMTRDLRAKIAEREKQLSKLSR